MAAAIDILNLRYRGSVEDEVHSALWSSLRQIRSIFGTIPDTLEDVWVATALGEVEEARRRISEVPSRHPFDLRYAQDLPETAWERCVEVLDRQDVLSSMKHLGRRLSVKGKTSSVSFDCCASLAEAQVRTRTKPEIVYAIDLAPKIRVGTEWAK